MNKLILWDFDGVIVPSYQAGYETYKVFHPEFTEDDYRLSYEGNVNEDPRGLNFTDTEFYVEYGPRLEKLGLVEQIDTVVKGVAAKYSSVIVSSSLTAHIQKHLMKHGLEESFKKIYGNDVHYSKVEKISLAFKEYNSDAQNAVFITDTLGDIKEAEAHNLKTIAVTWGFHPRATLERGKPDVIIDSPAKLFETVTDLLR